MSFEALHAAIGEENTALKFEKKDLASAAVNPGRKDRKKSKDKLKMGKDYVESICRTCQNRGPEDCWLKNSDNAPDWWLKRKGLNSKNEGKKSVAGVAIVCYATNTESDAWILDTGAGSHICNNLAFFVEI